MRPRPKLKVVLSTPDDPYMWKRLLNRLYLYEEDELFRWAKTVRETTCGEEEKSKGRAA